MPTELQFTPQTDQPQQPAQRSQGGILNSLLGLIGREQQPTLPPVQQVPNSRLIDAMDEARGLDPERMRQIRDIIERRTPDDIARGPQPVGPITPGDSSANPLSPNNPFSALHASNPFDVAGGAMQEARRRSGQ